jgi:hypothetical protein
MNTNLLIIGSLVAIAVIVNTKQTNAGYVIFNSATFS